MIRAWARFGDSATCLETDANYSPDLGQHMISQCRRELVALCLDDLSDNEGQEWDAMRTELEGDTAP